MARVDRRVLRSSQVDSKHDYSAYQKNSSKDGGKLGWSGIGRRRTGVFSFLPDGVGA